VAQHERPNRALASAQQSRCLAGTGAGTGAGAGAISGADAGTGTGATGWIESRNDQSARGSRREPEFDEPAGSERLAPGDAGERDGDSGTYGGAYLVVLCPASARSGARAAAAAQAGDASGNAKEPRECGGATPIVV
jgi:hypothetical protein